MVQPLRRAKVGDLAGSALLLVFYTALSFALLLTGRTSILPGPSQIGYTICIGVACPLAFVSSLPLIYFWASGRSVDKVFLSSATERHLNVIMAAIALMILAYLFTLAAQIIELITEVKQTRLLFALLTVAVIALLCWIVQLVLQMLLVVRETKRKMADERCKQSSPEQGDKRDSSALSPEFV